MSKKLKGIVRGGLDNSVVGLKLGPMSDIISTSITVTQKNLSYPITYLHIAIKIL